MGLIYTKSSEKTLILAPREGFQRAFDFQDWNEIRLGIFFSGVNSSGDNTGPVNEDVLVNTAADRICLGIKNSDNLNIPGTADSIFLGITNRISGTTNSRYNIANGTQYFSDAFGAGNAGMFGIGLNGTSIIQNSAASLAGLNFPADITGSSSYCGFYVIKFKLYNRGLSNQTISINSVSDNTISGSDYSPAALRTEMNNASFGTEPTALDWNDGSVAYDLPDAFYIRIPFYNNRIRISCMRASRYA